MKSILFFQNTCHKFKFNQSSKLLYVGTHQIIYLFHVKSNFKKLCKISIFCITDSNILTSSRDKYIIKTDVILKQQLFTIQAHNFQINGLDYSMKLILIASGSLDKSIKIWNVVDGSLIIENLSTQNQDKPIRQVQFVVNKDQLISFENRKNPIIWNINYKAKLLEQIQFTKTPGFYLSLILQQQFMIVSNYGFASLYTIDGEFIRYLKPQEDSFGVYQLQNFQGNNHVQADPIMVLMKGIEKLYVLKLEIVPI